MGVEIVQLLSDVNGRGLLMDVEGQLDVLVFKALLAGLPLGLRDLLLIAAHSLRIFERLNNALVSLLDAISLYERIELLKMYINSFQTYADRSALLFDSFKFGQQVHVIFLDLIVPLCNKNDEPDLFDTYSPC